MISIMRLYWAFGVLIDPVWAEAFSREVALPPAFLAMPDQSYDQSYGSTKPVL
jgi:hypothetical protein